ncbi:MAG: sarcosine oxidase subunit gamma [Beijerinckiaceae bacterium]
MADANLTNVVQTTSDDLTITSAPSQSKAIFRGRPAAIEAVGRALEMDLVHTTHRYLEKGSLRALWLGPDEWLFKSATDPEAVFRALSAACADRPHAIVDLSSSYMTLRVSGRHCALLINHGCPLDLSQQSFDVGRCTRTLLGKSEIILSRVDTTTFEIDVARSFAAYAEQFLVDAVVSIQAHPTLRRESGYSNV